MVLPLIVVFCTGAALSVVLAQWAGRPWVWVLTFVNVLIAFHELSFALRPTAEWIRIDLLLTIPLFSLGTLLLAGWAFRAERRLIAAAMAMSVAGGPLFFVLSR